jgi:hypothetical protein
MGRTNPVWVAISSQVMAVPLLSIAMKFS